MSFGKMAVDWEQRVDFNKLRKDRVENANKKLQEYGIGSAMVFQFESRRYLSSWFAHPYGRHLPREYMLFIRDNGHPYVKGGPGDWAPQEGAPWLKGRFLTEDKLPQPSTVRAKSEKNRVKEWQGCARAVKKLLTDHGVEDLPLSVDYGCIELFEALKKEGVDVVNGNTWMLEARMIKTPEEIELLRMAATCNEAAYTELARVLRPGMRECDAQAVMIKAAYEAGCEYVEGWVTGSGPRSAPRRFNSSDRTIRAGELFAIEMCHTTFNGYKNCMGRSFMVGAKPNEMQKEIYQTLVTLEDRVLKDLKPSMSTHEVARRRRESKRLFESVEESRTYRLSLQNHLGGMGMMWNELPYLSYEEPDRKLEPGMVIAYALRGHIRKPGIPTNAIWDQAGAHIENTVVVTETGNEVLTMWPWRELLIVGYPGSLYGEIKDQLNVTVT